jgi:minor extracellular serine protease Vpr
MAVEGPLLASSRRLLEEFGEHVLDLPQIPLPVRLWRVDRCSELRIDLLIALGGESANEWERALGELYEQGLRNPHWYGRAVFGSAEVSDLGGLVEADIDAFVEAAAIMRPALDLSVPEVMRAPSGMESGGPTGSDVIVGIVDSGIDLTHPSFRTPSNETRVLSYWNQPAQGRGKPPSRHEGGTEWDQAGIDEQLSNAQSGIPSAWTDPTGHGTRVAGVAAGNGRGTPSGRYVGVAQSADLIVVAVEARRNAFPSTNNVLEGVEYVFEQASALGKRAVVNVSQGVQIGAHQPTDRLETALAGLLAEDDERIVVVSAGNTGDANAHARFSVSDGGSFDLPLDVPLHVGPVVFVDIWYGVADGLDIEIVDPGSSTTAPIEDRRHASGSLGNEVYEVQGTPNVLGVGGNQLQVKLRSVDGMKNVRDGRWILRLHGRAIVSGRPVDAWLDRSLGISSPYFAAHGEADRTVTAPATASGAIAVGAYTMSPTVGRLSPSSGRGPDRNDDPVEMLAAPGGPVTTTESTYTGSVEFAPAYGTSLAAPHVTGAIALMLEAAPQITRSQALDCLRSSAHSDNDTNAGPASAWGAGKLDVGAALACAKSQTE